MGQYLYKMFTTSAGIYLGYLTPVLVFLIMVFNRILSKRRRQESLTWQDIIAVAAIGLLVVDFARYLYLLLTHTGRFLPVLLLFCKYAFGGCLWGWMFWYSFGKKGLIFFLVCAATLVFALIGVTIS